MVTKIKKLYEDKHIDFILLNSLFYWKSNIVTLSNFNLIDNSNETSKQIQFKKLNNKPSKYKDNDFYEHTLYLSSLNKNEPDYKIFSFLEKILRDVNEDPLYFDKLSFNLENGIVYTASLEPPMKFNLASKAKIYIKDIFYNCIFDIPLSLVNEPRNKIIVDLLNK